MVIALMAQNWLVSLKALNPFPAYAVCWDDSKYVWGWVIWDIIIKKVAPMLVEWP